MLLGQFHLFTPEDAAVVLENPGDAECQIEHTGRLLLPDHVLQRLAACQPPFLFRLTAGRNSVHLGYPVFRSFVPAATARQLGSFGSRNCVLVPSWAAAQLAGTSGAGASAQVPSVDTTTSSSSSGCGGSTPAAAAATQVGLSLESLPTGSFIRLRPLQPADVCSWANPAATLNKKLRDFACLSIGSVFSIRYLDRTFHFEVKSLRPGNAVCIIDCDMQLEFDLDSPPSSAGAAEDAAAAASDGGSEDVVLSDERLRRCGVTVPPPAPSTAGSLPTSPPAPAAATDDLLRDALARARAAADSAARRWGAGVALATGREVAAPAPASAPPASAATGEAASAAPNLAYEWGTLTFTRPGGRFERLPSNESSVVADGGNGGRGVRLKDSL